MIVAAQQHKQTDGAHTHDSKLRSRYLMIQLPHCHYVAATVNQRSPSKHSFDRIDTGQSYLNLIFKPNKQQPPPRVTVTQSPQRVQCPTDSSPLSLAYLTGTRALPLHLTGTTALPRLSHRYEMKNICISQASSNVCESALLRRRARSNTSNRSSWKTSSRVYRPRSRRRLMISIEMPRTRL